MSELDSENNSDRREMRPDVPVKRTQMKSTSRTYICRDKEGIQKQVVSPRGEEKIKSRSGDATENVRAVLSYEDVSSISELGNAVARNESRRKEQKSPRLRDQFVVSS